MKRALLEAAIAVASGLGAAYACTQLGLPVSISICVLLAVPALVIYLGTPNEPQPAQAATRAATVEPALDEALSTFARTGTEDTRAPGTPQPDPSATATNAAGRETPARREAFKRQAAAQANGKP